MIKTFSPYFIVVNCLCLLIIGENLSAQSSRINDHFKWFKQPYLELPQGDVGYVTKEGYSSIGNNHKYGLIDFDGNMQVEMISDEPLHKKGLIPVKNKNRIGVINLKGDTVFPCKASSFQYIGLGFYALSVGENVIILRGDGSQLKTKFPLRSLNKFTFQENALPVEFWLPNSNKTANGYIDTAGNSLMTPDYRFNDHFESGIAAVKSLDYRKNRFIDKKGNVVFECPDNWSTISSFDGPLAVIQVKGKDGFAFIDRNYKIVMEPQFNALGGRQHGLYIVSKNNKTGAINSMGKVIIPFQFTYINSITPGRCIVSTAFFKNQYKDSSQLLDYKNSYSKDGIYDIAKHAMIVPFEYDNLEDGGNGLLIAKKDDKYGYINDDGKPLSAFKFEKAGKFYNKRAWVKMNGKWGIIEMQ
jgi:hypothetical protein